MRAGTASTRVFASNGTTTTKGSEHEKVGIPNGNPTLSHPRLTTEKDSRITQQIPASPSNGHAGTR